MDAQFRDGGIFNLNKQSYIDMRREGSLSHHLEERARKLQTDLDLAQHRVAYDKSDMDK